MLKEWLKALLGLTVLLGVIEMLLPQGDIGKFAKLVLGLAVMLVVLQPLTEFLQPNLELPTLINSAVNFGDLNIESGAENLVLVGMKPLLQNENSQLLTDLEGTLLTAGSLENVRVELENGFLGLRLKVSIDPKTANSEEVVRTIIAKTLNLRNENILVVNWDE